MAKVFSILLGILFVLLLTQYCLFGVDKSFFENTINSLVASLIMLIPTIFILDKIIKQYNEKAIKRYERKRYSEILGNRHKILVTNLETAYFHYVTKKPASNNVTDEDFVKIVNNLDNYIDKNFLKKKYQAVILDENNIFEFRDIDIKYQDFFVSQFRDRIYNLFAEYIGRYVSIVPAEVLNSVYKIEDTLKNNVFTIPSDFAGINMDISNADFEPVGFIDPIKIIGEEIIKLKEYMNNED